MTEEQDVIPKITPLVPPTPVPLLTAPVDAAPTVRICQALHGLVCLGLGGFAGWATQKVHVSGISLADFHMWCMLGYFYMAPILGVVLHLLLLVLLGRRAPVARPLSRALPLAMTVLLLGTILPLAIPYALSSPIQSWAPDELIAVFVPLPTYLLLNGIILALLNRPDIRAQFAREG